MKNNRFAKLLALVLCMTAFAWSASAFEPEMPEPAAEVTEAAMASLSEAAYAAKPAESTAYGTLVFFDNGNPADAVSLTNMKLATLAETFGETDGYVTRSMTTYNGFTQGVTVVPAEGEVFTDSEGNALDGTLVLCAEIYNSADANKNYYDMRLQPGVGANWGPVYTSWQNKSTSSKAWTTLTFTGFPTSSTMIGMGRGQNEAPGLVRAVYVYYKPTPKYVSAPAAETADGTLVFFDNGNAADGINLYNMTLDGLQTTFGDADGYVTRGIYNDKAVFNGATHGPYVKTADGNPFTDADGKALDGTLTFCVEMYNAAAANKSFYAAKQPSSTSWDAWCGVYTNWKGVAAVAGSWTTLKYTFDASSNLIGFARTTWDPSDTYVRSVYVYYAPKPVYAARPAEETDKGQLIYFDNGNESDTFRLANITVKGLAAANSSAGGYITRMFDESAKKTLFADGTYGVIVAAEDGESFKFTDEANTPLPKGNVTICLDVCNKNDADRDFYGVVLPQPDPNWNLQCGFYTAWQRMWAKAGTWTTVNYTFNTSAHTIGLERGDASLDGLYIRSIAVYYKPEASVSVTTSDSNSIRTGVPSGIRFGGFMGNALLNIADECGFIVARGDLLEEKALDAADEVKIAAIKAEKDGGAYVAETKGGLTLVGARNYRKDGSVNKLIAAPDGKTPFGTYEEDGVYFTGVVTNLDGSYSANGVTYANRYAVPLAARSYVRIGSIYYYGDLSLKSVKDVAEAIKAAGGEAYTANEAYIEKILAEAGQTVTE